MTWKKLVKTYIEPYRLGWLFVLIEATLIIVTAIDKLIHQTLYKYGLQFSYAWADAYWLLLFLLYLLIGLVFTVTYWVSATEKSRYLAFLLCYTVVIQLLGGILDTFFFLISGEFPSGTWWWNPFNRFLGIPWDTRTNILWNMTWIGITLALWDIYFQKRFAE